MDKDLTMKKRRRMWMMVEKAKREKKKRVWVRITNRRIWIEGVEWRWLEEKEVKKGVEEEEVE